jgi:predicted nuclease of predicted toxin-antitoxin system
VIRFLIDANLPAQLAEVFIEAGHDCVHMETLLPRYSPDTEIAHIANDTGAVIVTRDADFVEFSHAGVVTVPVVLLRFGNLRRAAIATSIRSRLSKIIAAIAAGEKIVVLR